MVLLLCTEIISVTNAETPQLPPKLSTLLVLIKAQKPIKIAPFHFVYVYNSYILSPSLSALDPWLLLRELFLY